MKRLYVGFDTSNYTTSCARFDAEAGCFESNVKRLLTVREGERGLRQSDAVFSHVKNLPEVSREALLGMESDALRAVGVSVSPRDEEGSYMPCFLAGEVSASALASAMGRPMHTFSHQAGHVMAAVWSSGSPDLLCREFLAFHVSGGTTELLAVTPQFDAGGTFLIKKIGGTLDLNAGQAIDRSGVAMGLSFPAGPALEQLAMQYTGRTEKSRLSVRNCECNLSGVENRVRTMLDAGEPKEKIAAWVFDFIGRTLITLTDHALELLGDRPVLYAGGVMSSSILKGMLRGRFTDARFAEPKFSSDNAAGCALLCAVAEEGCDFWKR